MIDFLPSEICAKIFSLYYNHICCNSCLTQRQALRTHYCKGNCREASWGQSVILNGCVKPTKTLESAELLAAICNEVSPLFHTAEDPTNWSRYEPQVSTCRLMMAECISERVKSVSTQDICNNYQDTNWYITLLHHTYIFCNIWGFHGGDYEEWCLLGCYVVWLL
jgi:hypothetical protein